MGANGSARADFVAAGAAGPRAHVVSVRVQRDRLHAAREVRAHRREQRVQVHVRRRCHAERRLCDIMSRY